MIEFREEDCLWQRLKKETRPIVLYGTGNGADKILDVCQRYDITVSGVFASDGFVRNRTFRGFDVESLEAIEKRLGDGFTALLCFGTTRKEVINCINSVAARHTLYIPDVPLFGGELFDFDYYTVHKNELEKVRRLLSDGESASLFEDMLGFRLTGEGRYLSRVQTSADSYTSLLGGGKYDVCIDCGAFIGDSTAEIAAALKPRKIIAAEPDPRTFKKLSAYAENENACTVETVQAAISDYIGEVDFTSAASRGSGAGANAKRSKVQSIKCLTVDSLCRDNDRIDFIKYDVEGAESAALRGSIETIRRHSPALAVSLYHRSADIFMLPLFLAEECGYTEFYLRRVPCIPAWDLTLFAKK